MAKSLTRHFSRRQSSTPHKGQSGHEVNGNEPSEVERQAAVMKKKPRGLYERFRRGLLEYHSEVGFFDTCQMTSADDLAE